MIELLRRIKGILVYDIKNQRCGRCGRKISSPFPPLIMKVQYELESGVKKDVKIIEYCSSCMRKEIS